MKLQSQTDYSRLKNEVSSLLENARPRAYQQVNQLLLQTYWQIGQKIVEFEQKGSAKAEYGQELLTSLSKKLKPLGKGFSRSNLTYMRLLYLKYPKSETLSHKLSWSHYFEILKIENDLARNFYEKQTIWENVEGDSEAIGLILSAQRNDILVEYALGGLSNRLFVSKYQVYLPKKEELETQIRKLIQD